MRVMIITFAVLLGIWIAILVYQRFSDGPTGPLTGGPFRSGEPGSLKGLDELDGDFEFELSGFGTTRTAGGIVVDDSLYITCDLGFLWNRLPFGVPRYMLHVIWWFKDWHEKAQLDGRVRIRKRDQVYSGNILLVEDQEKIAALKTALEGRAKKYLGGEIGPRPAETPNDVLFFSVQIVKSD